MQTRDDDARATALQLRETSYTPGNCCVHARMAWTKHEYKKLRDDKSNAQFQEFKGDVSFLAYLAVVFAPFKNFLLMKFSEKWRAREPRAFARWSEEYLEVLRKSYWSHMSIPAGYPNHNNINEAMNKVVKDECTEWDKKPVAEFFDAFAKWYGLKSLSTAQYHKKIELNKKDFMYAQAALWSIQFNYKATLSPSPPLSISHDPNVPMMTAPQNTCVVIPSTDLTAAVTAKHGTGEEAAASVLPKLDKFLRFLKGELMEDEDFDEIKRCLKAAYLLYPTHSQGAYAPCSVACTCREYVHYAKCPHALAYDIGKKKITVPGIWDMHDIGVARGNWDKHKAKRGGAYGEKPPPSPDSGSFPAGPLSTP